MRDLLRASLRRLQEPASKQNKSYYDVKDPKNELVVASQPLRQIDVEIGPPIARVLSGHIRQRASHSVR